MRRRRNRAAAPVVAVAALFVAAIGASIGVSIARVNAVDTYQGCTVTEKEDRALASLDERAPRVYTDCGVFVVSDEPFRLHFAAADVYNALQVGETYDMTTVGWRVGLFSWFPNIVEVSS
jgi:hypothetical protein